MRKNAAYYSLIGGAGVITALFLFPYLRDVGHPFVSLFIFAALGILAVYGRHNR